MRILVIGAGAVSGYFGARLVQHGRDVTFLVREQRARVLREQGLRIGGAFGEFTVTPTLLSAQELSTDRQTFDVIMLGVKAYSLAHAIEDFTPAVGETTVILPLLNGMSHIERLSARFGAKHVLGGLTRIVADLDTTGRITLMEKLHDVTFGELDRQRTPRVLALEQTLRGCGFDAELSPDIVRAMWFKWTLLSSIGAITLLGRGTIGEINRVPGGRELALAVVAEAAAIAGANGYALTSEQQAIISARLTKTDSTLVSSMYRDLHKDTAVEADHIFGDLLRRGEAAGVHAPLLRVAYTQTKVYEAKRA